MQAEGELCKAMCNASKQYLKIDNITCIGNTEQGEDLTVYTDRKNHKVLPIGLSLFLVQCTVENNYLRGYKYVKNAYHIPGNDTSGCTVYCLVQEVNVKKFIYSCRNARSDFSLFTHCVVPCVIISLPSENLPFSIEKRIDLQDVYNIIIYDMYTLQKLKKSYKLKKKIVRKFYKS